MDVTIDPTGLALGDHSGKITITAPNAANSPQIVNVDLSIVAAPTVFGDVAPRPNGDGMLLSNDVTVERQFVVGNLVPSADEFTRADCAPKATHGDGMLTAGDTIQVRRYVAGLDTQGTIEASRAKTNERLVDPRSGTRTIRVASQTSLSGSKVSIPVELVPNGDELAAAMTLNFDPAKLSNPVIQLANGISGDAILTTNMSEAESGKVVILVDSSEAFSIFAMPKQFLNITFDVASDIEGSTDISFGSSTAVNSVADANGDLLPTNFINGSVTIAPSKARISGRVLTAEGVGIRNARVILTDADGALHTATTGSFGYYSFDGISVDGISVGRGVLIAVSSKRYRFDSQMLTTSAGSSDVNFVAKE
jgi:hypothetical protein